MWQTTHISGWAYDDTEEENLVKVDKDVAEKDSRQFLFLSKRKFLYRVKEKLSSL